MTKLDELLAEIERLDREATKGPFVVADNPNSDIDSYYAVRTDEAEPWWIVDTCANVDSRKTDPLKEEEANARFFARSRSLLPLLAKIVREILTAQAIRDLSSNPSDYVEFDTQEIAERVLAEQKGERKP